MEKMNIAVIFGGSSSEYNVSLESACSVISNLDKSKYQPVMIGITRQGEWFHFTGDVQEIKYDTWYAGKDCAPAVLSPGRREHRLFIFCKDGGTDSVPIDVAFPVLHGKNGEDGTVQGMIALAGIPLAGCKVLASALCMDKDRAHKLVETAGICVPRARVFGRKEDIGEIKEFAKETGYPLFVKPVKAGSSFGVTKAGKPDELQEAVKLAFLYDDQIIVEENIDGFEVGCAVLGNESLTVGEVDEIELSGGFFDFTEKYTLKTSAIHVPARISSRKAREIKETAKAIYKTLGCSGFARVDMFLTPEGKIVFNEVNTIPGFTEHSRYPGMMKAAGYSFTEILEKIIGLALENN
ncbi:D-alanine--D-serine ligase VanG [Parablautia intestinalis]|uniref:D-alanine--D-alanine ligase n=1 Tax=Parablautia intestinalis TaxID=2320100 RepID=A0A3A9AC60_9FIRM|nr:D-alanine--D-serine ligase VanG [Parablautia intestinalis]RKI88694.1 D-alanine--D-serine ligase VanG [Parablautia intestinalis]